MILRSVIEILCVVAVIIGLCYEEKIAMAERRFVKRLFKKHYARVQREEHIRLKLREARYMRNQHEREMELLELGLDPRPRLSVVKSESPAPAAAAGCEEVA